MTDHPHRPPIPQLQEPSPATDRHPTRPRRTLTRRRRSAAPTPLHGEAGLLSGLKAGASSRYTVTESLLLSGLGGLAGIALGAAATAVYARAGDLPWVVPLWAVTGGFAATLAIGTLAGLYPAVRAARLSPTLALAAG
ncbi:FtsX-like permease family protein [Streptomyces sp. NBC_00047]|uniref:ABC transporter permease n=1 Tax=Streptomyces sp. NBC_00047 TaxID=2975627 RepID=UPI002B1D6465|nr:FtsX-like permease family protein [Streptomyces sp. NBC_00047]